MFKILSNLSSFKTFSGIKKELKQFFSLNGYSKLLETDNLYQKLFYALSVIILFLSCILFIVLNAKNYFAWEVITDIRTLSNLDSLTFPAIVFCLNDFGLDNAKSLELDNLLLSCKFSFTNVCNISDFEKFSVWYESENKIKELNCFKFNGGRNLFGQPIDLLSSKRAGEESGLNLLFNLTTETIFYKIK